MQKDEKTKAQKAKENEAAKRPTDPEHDARLHLKIEPHGAPGEYDPEYQHYRTQGG